MYYDTVFAGFGGQGVMLIGNLWSYAAMEAGLNITYMPVYGVEMRGGTANCTVVVSDQPVGSPVVPNPCCALAMNRPSAEKFGPVVRKDGLFLVNSSLVEDRYVKTKARKVVCLPALELAQEVGNPRLANMVMLGALAQLSGVLKVENVIKALPQALDPRYHSMIPINSQAIKLGAQKVA